MIGGPWRALNMKIQNLLAFPHMYDVDISPETIASSLHYYYPSASLQGGGDGVCVEVTPNEHVTWIGTFQYGEIRHNKACSGVYSCPDVNTVCVVSGGAGYFVDVNNPSSCKKIEIPLIISVYPVVEKEIIIFFGLTEAVAYGKSGVRWRSSRISWDSLSILEVAPDLIRGEYMDIRTDQNTSFSINIDTGEVHGGIEESVSGASFS